MRNIHCSIISATTRHEKVSNPCRIYTLLFSPLSLFLRSIMCCDVAAMRCAEHLAPKGIRNNKVYTIMVAQALGGSIRRPRATTKNLDYDVRCINYILSYRPIAPFSISSLHA
uniref:Uncharacterized protein n=1 Tax=Trichogramma kaykai TaxID=54128 RepID=A0ABD2XBH6_9HYME